MPTYGDMPVSMFDYSHAFIAVKHVHRERFWILFQIFLYIIIKSQNVMLSLLTPTAITHLCTKTSSGLFVAVSEPVHTPEGTEECHLVKPDFLGDMVDH